MNPGLGVRNGELAFLNGTSGADTLPQGSRLTPVSVIRTLEPRSRRSRRFKVGSVERPEPGGRTASDSASGTSWESPGRSAQPSSPAADSQLPLPSLHLEPGARIEVLRWENGFENQEAETDVDTGFTVVSSGPRQSFLSRFPRDRSAGGLSAGRRLILLTLYLRNDPSFSLTVP